MTKSAMPLLLVAMMAASGFAVAQVKDGSEGKTAGPAAAAGKSVTTREAVKAEAIGAKSGKDGSDGATPSDSSAAKAAPKMTAEEKKAKRAEARAARKARLAGKANNPPVKDGKQSN